MKEIVFVDDDEHLLAGLRRMLWRYKDEWSMRFVPSGEAALAALEDQPADLVVSDVRMPGMDGIALLSEIQTRYPRTIRIILSGQTDRMDAVRATGVAHQFIAKPCSAETLHGVIGRATALRDLLGRPDLLALVDGTLRLPSPPSLYFQLTDEILSEEPSLARIGAIVAQDPAMSAEVLRIVDSAFFSLRREVTDVEQAVALLGSETIRSLALAIHLFREAEQPGVPGAVVEEVQAEAFRVATTARSLIQTEGAKPGLVVGSFTAGLLHDVGKLILFQAAGRALDPSGEKADPAQEGVPVGSDLVGAYLLSVWGLPDEIVEAVAYHRHPGDAGVQELSPLMSVHVARALVDRADGEVLEDLLDMEYLAACGLADHVDRWERMGEEDVA